MKGLGAYSGRDLILALKRIKSLWDKISPELKYILLLFLTTRILLTTIGTLSRLMLYPLVRNFTYSFSNGVRYNLFNYSEHIWLDIWGSWDTGWYLHLAENWYPKINSLSILSQQSYAFFPLYPLIVKLLQMLIGNYFVSGIIISNISMIFACVYLYKLVSIVSDNQTALRSVKYLFLFPTAFFFSGVFTEATFTALSIAAFYYAEKEEWGKVGILGFLLSLTRPLGVLAFLPLIYIYFMKKNFRYTKIKSDICFLLFIPLGLALYSGYNYYQTGDFLAFAHIQRAWGRHLINPIILIFDNLFRSDVYTLFSILFILISLSLLNIFYRKIGFAYWLLGMYSIIIPLSTSVTAQNLLSMPRFTTVIFPLYILFAKLTKNDSTDQAMTIALALLQGFTMVFWAGFFLIV